MPGDYVGARAALDHSGAYRNPLFRQIPSQNARNLERDFLDGVDSIFRIKSRVGRASAQGDVHFHAMLIDLGLPDCSGEDVLRQIAQLKPGLQIVVATGADTSAVRIRVGADPAISYLEKPFQFSDLEAILPPVQSAAAS